MGAAAILQDSIKSTSSALWSMIPTTPEVGALNFNLQSYNKSFVNFSVVVGAITLAYSSVSFGKKAVQYLNGESRLPTRKQLLEKYGRHAWALVTDCCGNQQYCKFLVENGFSLILMGAEEDIKIVKDQVLQIQPNSRIEIIPVNWKKDETNIKFYQHLHSQLEHYDIAFLILPKLHRSKSNEPTHIQQIEPFQHIYLLVRFFGSKLKWRSYRSAVIFPSYPDIDDFIQCNNGTNKALIAGSDAFGRIIGFQFKGTVDVVVARGSVQNAFKGLGKQRITY